MHGAVTVVTHGLGCTYVKSGAFALLLGKAVQNTRGRGRGYSTKIQGRL